MILFSQVRYMKGGESEDDTLVTWIGNQNIFFVNKITFFFNSFLDVLYTFLMGKTNHLKN